MIQGMVNGIGRGWLAQKRTQNIEDTLGMRVREAGGDW